MEEVPVQVDKVAPKPSRAACVSCHHRKIRCDARLTGLPCTNCRIYLRPDCRLHQKKRKRVCDRPVQPAATPHPQSAKTSPALTPPSASVENAKPAPQDGSIDANTPSGSSSRSARQMLEETGIGEYKMHLVEFIDQDDMWQRPIDQAARMTYVGTDVSNLNFLIRNQGGDKTAGVYHYPANRISHRFLAHEPDRRPVEAFELPDKSIVDELLQAYFEKVNPGFPVVDEDLFMTQYRARDHSNPPSLLLLQAILLVGAHVSRQVPERERLKAMFYRRAKILFDTRFERNRDTIVQSALLLTWHSDGPEDISANSWFWIGVATRTALGLGMHRDATPSTLVAHNKRMWRRVWWLLFQCDVLAALQYGRPQAINLEDCDTRKLVPADFEGCGPHPQIDYIIQSTELCIILSGSLRRVFGPSVTPARSKDALRDVDAALARWTLLLPDSLRLRPTITLEFWPSVLHITYNNALILLHRPRPHAKSSLEALGPNDADICSAAAGVIQSLFESLCERDSLKYLWISSVNCLFTAMIQLSVEVRISNPILAIAALRRYDSTFHSLRKLAECWPNAETLLHFFERSTKLVRPDPETLGDDTIAMLSRNSITSRFEDPDNTGANNPYQAPGLEHGNGTQDFSDWRLLFPTAENGEESLGHNGSGQNGEFVESRQEWREIYWQNSEALDEVNMWNG